MRRIRVDFNNMTGLVVPVPLGELQLHEHEAILVYDDSTEDYLGHVIGMSEATAFVEVSRDPYWLVHRAAL